MSVISKDKSPDYKAGYKVGYARGKREVEADNARSTAYWIMKKDGWYCSKCGTKYNQFHSDYCCKCGRKMSDEAR